MNGLRPYPAYRDSGHPWLGEVPEHWEVRRAKYLVKERDQRWDDDVGRLLSVSQYTGVTERRKREGTEEHDTRSDSLRGYKVVARDDLVVNIMLAWNGSTGVSAFDGVTSPAYSVFRFREGEPWFFHTLLRSPVYKGEVKRRSRGVVESRLRLYPDDLGRLPILVPPPPEQAAIVKVLSAVDRRVNRLVRAKRRLLALLAEQKQAVITHAVTRGLDPSAPTKPSGVPWLGEVPEHWEVLPLRRFCRVIDCKHVTVDFVAEGIPLASVREVKGFELDLSSAKQTTPDWADYLRQGRRQPRAGDIIYCRNVGVGASAVVTNETPACAMGQDVCLLRTATNGRFLNYVLQSQVIKTQLAGYLLGSTFPRINVDDVKALVAVQPLPREQDLIVQHLDLSLQAFVSAELATRREIDLIREYRTRLVADVVTGKLDVRAVAEALPDDVEDEEPADINEATTDEAADGLEPVLAGEDAEDA